jgi:hypothetical protein
MEERKNGWIHGRVGVWSEPSECFVGEFPGTKNKKSVREREMMISLHCISVSVLLLSPFALRSFLTCSGGVLFNTTRPHQISRTTQRSDTSSLSLQQGGSNSNNVDCGNGKWIWIWICKTSIPPGKSGNSWYLTKSRIYYLACSK